MMVPRFGALRMNNIKYLTVPNTDGRVNKLVTLFAFAPAPKTVL
jgi:hypothetical protein